jgi:hypothetical protein
MEIDAVVEEGGVLHVPLPEGTPVRIVPKKLAEYSRHEWVSLVDAVAGSIPDLARPEPWSSRPIENLD